MSNNFEAEAKGIVKNAPAPDAEATTMKEAQGEEKPKKRGRPKGSTVKKQSKSAPSKADMAAIERGAKGVNTAIFACLCAFLGTGDAWPEKEQEEIMDKAMARYFEVKGYEPPPELILLAAYWGYAKTTMQKPSVMEKLEKRFGGIKGKLFSFRHKFKSGEKSPMKLIKRKDKK